MATSQNIIENFTTMEKFLTAVEKLQKRFLYKRFIRSLYKNKDLIDKLNTYLTPPEHIDMFNPTGTMQRRYDELQKLLLDKKNIFVMRDILNKLYRYTGVNKSVNFTIDGRKLLMSWMITSFPEVIIGKEKHEMINSQNYPDDVYFVTLDFIKEITLMTSVTSSRDPMKFFKSFNQYSNAVTYFLEKDRTEKLTELLNQYFDIGKTLLLVERSDKYSEQEKIDSANELKKSRDTIFSFVNILDKTIKREDADLYAQTEILRTERTEELQYQILVNDITEKKFVFLPRIIEEIKESFSKLGGRKIQLVNSNGSSMDIDDLLDGEMFIRKFTYMSFSKGEANAYGDLMMVIVNGLQTPASVIETNRKWNELKESDFEINEYFSKMLFFVLKEIVDIKESILNYVALTNLGAI